MKRLVLGLFLLLSCSSIFSQANPDLKKRLDEFLKFNNEMNFEKVLDYSYPKLFTLAPRKDMLAFFEKMYNSDQFSIKLDSLKIDSLYPVFKFGDGLYAKVKYSMLMRMTFKKDSLLNGVEENPGVKNLKAQFGEDNVRLDNSTNTVNISLVSEMVAAKDSFAKEWCFVNFKENDKITDALFSKELIQKIAAYK